ARIGDTSDISLRIGLKGSGLTPGKDFTELQVGNSPSRWAALTSKQVQAAVEDAEAYTKPAQDAGMHILVNLQQQKLPYVASGLMVTADFAKQNPNTVLAALQGLMDGAAYFADEKNKADSMAEISKMLRMKPDDPQVAQIYDAYRTRPATNPYPDKAGMDTVLEAYKGIDAQRYASITSDQIIDGSFMDKLRPGSGNS
ncbi:MAG TPA: ABC transporter substrate-binding protein, partial [Chloroflexota bacterium]|nr:ABC transporter substrate-binding protein [Chloroflexota bacterium]